MGLVFNREIDKALVRKLQAETSGIELENRQMEQKVSGIEGQIVRLPDENIVLRNEVKQLKYLLDQATLVKIA